ncbi:Mu transposase domain-containing protein [Streptomyces sp. NPDC055749]
MLTLPPVDPPRWWRFATRIGRDHYIRVDTCDYAVHPLAIGRKVQVCTDTDEVIVTLPPRRSRSRPPPAVLGETADDHRPVHARAAALLGDELSEEICHHSIDSRMRSRVRRPILLIVGLLST